MILRREAILLLATGMAAAIVPRARAEEPLPDFAPGQMWSLKNYPAKVIVGIVEPWYDTVVVLVSVTDIPGDVVKQMSFLPIEKPALAASVDKLLARDAKPLPGFEALYKSWKTTPGSGIYSATVPATIDMIFGKGVSLHTP